MPHRPERASPQKRLDALFQPWARTDAPGLVVGVSQAGETLYRRGFGMASLETAVANGPTTRMRIGSTSKHFTCLLLLLLHEDGKIDLDAPIRTYVPELEGDVGKPTLHQLMLHRGGGRDYVDLGVLTHGWNATPPGAALGMQARQTEQNFAPGEAMIYNNGGYHLLSIAAERAGGAPFETLLQDRLFRPLGLSDTVSAPSDHVILPGMATLHMPGPDGEWRRGIFPSEEVKGEGAIVSTIDDMLRWAAHLRTRDRFGASETWRALFTPADGADASLGAYALGLQLADYRGLRTISHSGGVLGGSCEMMTLPDRELEIVLLVNGAPGANPSALALGVVDILLEDELAPRAAPPVAADYARHLGEWWSPHTGMVYGLINEEGALKVEVCGQPFGIDLTATADGRVLLPEAGVGDLEFLFGKAGSEELPIGFGGLVSAYRRLDRGAVDKPSFGQSIEGRYYCLDTDATATFTWREDQVSVRIEDGHGSVEGPVTPLGADVAGIGPLAMMYWCVISLEREGGRVTGFRLNAMRTRRLDFRRI
jgi:CubicO group peptidase (beta-lactamase class C family)